MLFVKSLTVGDFFLTLLNGCLGLAPKVCILFDTRNTTSGCNDIATELRINVPVIPWQYLCALRC